MRTTCAIALVANGLGEAALLGHLALIAELELASGGGICEATHKITTKLIRDKARSENYINKSSLSWHRNYVSFHCSTYKSFLSFLFCLNRFRSAFYEFLNRLPSPEKKVFYVNKSNLPSSKSNGFQLLFLPLSRVAQTKKRSVKTNQSIIDRQIRGDLITGAFPKQGKEFQLFNRVDSSEAHKNSSQAKI